MDNSRPSSRSRRSYPNLHSLSLAPLSSQYPLDASAPPSPSEESPHTARTSYIAQKSAPTTPGILSLSQSRSNSRSRRPNSKRYAYDGYFMNPDAGAVKDTGDIPKAKSTNALLPGVSFADQVPGSERQHKRKGTAPLPLRLPVTKHHTNEASDEWFHRAGLAIAGETRDSKGQGWLVRRESSTSLVAQTDEFEEHPSHDSGRMALLSGEHLTDADMAIFTPRMSRVGSRINSRVGSRVVSRVPSRVHSTHASRRGSRVGSKIDLIMSAGVKTPNARHSLDIDETMFEEDLIEPDFVQGEEESDGDEEEVARLAQDRGFGLGGWMDRLLGWTLFSVDEDGEESDEEDQQEDDDPPKPENMTKEEMKLRREVEAKRRKLERETIVAASALRSQGSKDAQTDDESNTETGAEGAPRPPGNEGGGWQDAAWLFSVASKVLL